MNWEAIAAVGEILSAIAVLITLGYLAIQIRQNTHSMKISAMSTLHNVHTLTENNEKYIATLGKIARAEEVSGEERALAVERFFTVVRSIQSVWQQSRLDVVSQDQFDEYLDLLRWALSVPETRRMWVHLAPTFAPDFRDVVESQVLAADAPPSRMVKAAAALDPDWVDPG